MEIIRNSPAAIFLLFILGGLVVGLLVIGFLAFTGKGERLEKLSTIKRWNAWTKDLNNSRLDDKMHNPWVQEDEQLEALSEAVSKLRERDPRE